jgi:uncharacterized protein YciI
MKSIVIKNISRSISICTLVLSGMVHAESPCFPGFVGDVKTVVQFEASKNVSKFGQFMNDHLAFFKKGVQDGRFQYGGPLLPFDLEKNNPPKGAFLIVNDANLDNVKQLMKEDPFIVNDVFNYTLKSWLQCTLPLGGR